MTILYEVENNLYVNITNKCPCSCIFCLRQTKDEINDSGSLWLEREPTLEEIMKEFDKFELSKYGEVVFCGFGEPTERLEVLLKVAKYVKESLHMPVRVNSNGLSDLINGKDTARLFEGVVDSFSISLNTPNKEEYDKVTRNIFGLDAFDALLVFAKNVKKYVDKVVLTTVETAISKEDEDLCKQICDEIGVEYRIRPWVE